MAGKAVGQDRYEGTALAAGQHGVDHRAPVRPQHAAVIGHGHACRTFHRQVDQLRRIAAQGRVLTIVAHGGNYVVTQLGLCDQARDFFRRVLQIGIQGNHQVALALLETGHDRGVLPVVAIEDDGHHGAAFASGRFLEQLCRVVAAAVVDHDDFVVVGQLLAGGFGATQQFGQAVLFVVDRDDDRYAVNWIRLQGRGSRMFSIAPMTRSASSQVMSGNSGIEHRRAEFHSVLGRWMSGKRWR
ncbi:hypothetical protein D3C80_1320550 [compost metagenome]